jgi:UDP-N-acetylmuramoyl-tripeptide--D-alanyl-D-alanine ligase
MKNLFLKILKWKLKTLAKLTIGHFRPKIVAITGSAGKTTTKEQIYAVLKDYKRVRKSKANLNNELGIPLAIIGDFSEDDLRLVSRAEPAGKRKIKKFFFWMKAVFSGFFSLVFMKKSAYPEILILEYAADRPGDIQYLLDIARPDVGVITAIGEIPVHVEFFPSPESVLREKSKVVEYLPASGFAVLNFDSELVLSAKEKTRGRIITFGFKDEADVRVSNFENRSELNVSSGQLEPFGISFKLEYGGSFIPVIVKNIFGRAQAYAVAAATCVGLIFDLNLVEIAESISKNYSPAKGRMNLFRGIKESYVIDDAYNASPISMKEALETVIDLPGKRKVGVLGDMLELGKYSIEAHEEIGRLAAGVFDVLVTVGPRGKFIAGSAVKSGFPRHKVLSFDTVNEAGKAVQSLVKKGDLILIKASRGVGLDKIIEEIKEVEAAPIAPH